MLEALDRAAMRRHDVHRGAGFEQRPPRLGQLDLLEAIGRQNGDFLPSKLLRHLLSPSLWGLPSQRCEVRRVPGCEPRRQRNKIIEDGMAATLISPAPRSPAAAATR